MGDVALDSVHVRGGSTRRAGLQHGCCGVVQRITMASDTEACLWAPRPFPASQVALIITGLSHPPSWSVTHGMHSQVVVVGQARGRLKPTQSRPCPGMGPETQREIRVHCVHLWPIGTEQLGVAHLLASVACVKRAMDGSCNLPNETKKSTT